MITVTDITPAVVEGVVNNHGQLVLGAAYPDGIPEPVFADGALSLGGGIQAYLLTVCFGCAAAVTFASCALSVIYLKVLFWRDEHDLNTSGIALSVSAVFIACVLYSVASVVAIAMVTA